MKIHEPRQIRKEATVSEPFHVPQGCLIGANCVGNACRDVSNEGARPSILKLVERQVFLFARNSYVNGFLYENLKEVQD